MEVSNLLPIISFGFNALRKRSVRLETTLAANLGVPVCDPGVDAQICVREFLVVSGTLSESSANASQIMLCCLARARFTLCDTPFGEWLRLCTLLGRVSLLDGLLVV